jgi:hypothetical protein
MIIHRVVVMDSGGGLGCLGSKLSCPTIAHRPPYDQSFFQVPDTRPVPRSAQRMAQGRQCRVAWSRFQVYSTTDDHDVDVDVDAGGCGCGC